MTLAAPPLLRRGDTRDLATMDALMAAAFEPRFGEAWTRAQCQGVLSMPGIRLTLAHADPRSGEPRATGFTLVRTILDEAELLLIAVAPAARGTGVGGALLAAVVADGQAAGVRRLHLEVRADNPAVRLYRRHGFEQVGVRPGYYRGAGEVRDAHTFALTL